jgi:F1F0 ATPase subunit 2
MNEVLAVAAAQSPWFVLALAALAGAALGAVFFGGLWWTARRGTASPRPALWFFVSLLLRMGIALAGLFAVGGGRWERLLACLLGVVVARSLVLRLTRPPQAGRAAASQGVGHAS